MELLYCKKIFWKGGKLMRHDDMFLWSVINDVLPEDENASVKEWIYDELYRQTWTIAKIEALYAEVV